MAGLGFKVFLTCNRTENLSKLLLNSMKLRIPNQAICKTADLIPGMVFETSIFACPKEKKELHFLDDSRAISLSGPPIYLIVVVFFGRRVKVVLLHVSHVCFHKCLECHAGPIFVHTTVKSRS